MPRAPQGPMAPEVLEEVEARLLMIRRPVPAAQLAERLLQLGVALRNSPRPPRDIFIIAAATALVGADECAARDRKGEPARSPNSQATGQTPDRERAEADDR